jgi:hypothetical protein
MQPTCTCNIGASATPIPDPGPVPPFPLIVAVHPPPPLARRRRRQLHVHRRLQFRAARGDCRCPDPSPTRARCRSVCVRACARATNAIPPRALLPLPYASPQLSAVRVPLRRSALRCGALLDTTAVHARSGAPATLVGVWAALHTLLASRSSLDCSPQCGTLKPSPLLPR